MRRRLLSLLLALVAVPLSPGSALAVGTLDQEALPGSPEFCCGFGGQLIWQTFTAGLSGGLDTVSIWASSPGGTFDVTLREVDGGGSPTGVILAAGTASPSAIGWTDIALTPVVSVTSGTMYAIVMATPIPWVIGAAYAGGAAAYTAGGLPASDIAFRTFVTVAQPIEPPLVSLLVESAVATTQDGAYGSSATVPVGSTVWRRIGVANNGTSTLLGVMFGDSVISGNLPGSCPAFPASFPAGATYSCTFSQSVIAGEVVFTTTARAGSISSSASVTVTGTIATTTSVGSKLGLPTSTGEYTVSTKVASTGRYVTWQANLGMAAAGETVGVYMSAKGSDGTWGPWSRLTSRIADNAGTALFSWREADASWLSVRFSLDGERFTRATQARWR